MPNPASTTIRGVLKLYISNSELSKFNIGDSFYISKINKDYIISSLNADQKVLLPVEAKYVLDLYFDKEVSSERIKVSVRNKIDNKVKFIKVKIGAKFLIKNFSKIMILHLKRLIHE